MRNAVARAVLLAALFSISCASAADNGPSSPSPGRVEVLAPIDGLDVRVLESSPPQYMLNVRAGLPSGCAERNRHEFKRDAETVIVTVLNWVPAGNPPCTAIYGSYELNLNLGSDFRSGVTYSVNVNGRITSFVAQ
jgi:hypothetical protein